MNTVTNSAISAETTTKPTGLDRMLRPRSIAIVGANDDPRTIGGSVLANLDAFGFTGDIHLVSRKKTRIGERSCLPDILSLPEGIDLLVLIVPKAAIADAIRDSIARKIGSVVVFSAGFAETGEEGRILQEELAALCREADMPMLGPNCMGFINYKDGVPITFERMAPRALGTSKAVGIIAQSGATASNIRAAMHGRAIDVSCVVATGNEAQTGAEDYIEAMLDDPQIGLIAVYVEQIRNGPRFLDVAHRARAKGVPIVMLHPGASDKGAEAALSHTGAMAGNHAAMRTAMRYAGVAIVETTEELFDVSAILLNWPTPVPGGVGVISNSGAIRGLSFDFCEAIELPIAPLAQPTLDRLSAEIDGAASNPLDIGTTGFVRPEIFGTSTQAMLDDPAVGVVLNCHVGGAPNLQIVKSDHLLPVFDNAQKPVVLTILGDEDPLDPAFVKAVRDSGIPFFRSPERALRAIRVVQKYADDLAALQTRKTPAINLPRLEGKGTIPEYRGKDFLRELGIGVPNGRLATTVAEAEAAASDVGYPVVLKAQAAALAHKSDAGGVAVGIADATALRAAWEKMYASVGKARPDITLDGILIEAMDADGTEMIVGASRDPNWGPVILVGLGGVWTEILADTRLLPADIDQAGAMREISMLRSARMLGAFRGKPARDVAALADVIVRLGALMRAQPDIAEIDINPLIVRDEGKGVTALDALFVLN